MDKHLVSTKEYESSSLSVPTNYYEVIAGTLNWLYYGRVKYNGYIICRHRISLYDYNYHFGKEIGNTYSFNFKDNPIRREKSLIYILQLIDKTGDV